MLQILACLTGDRLAAMLCNVVDIGSRADAYTKVFEVVTSYMLSRMGEAAGLIKREDCKQAIMTALYGSTAEPKKVFGEGKQLQIFYEVMKELAPLAWKLNEDFLSMWNPTKLTNDWVLPDNFHVHVKVMGAVKESVQFRNEPYEIVRQVNMPAENGRSLGANTIHSIDGMIVREMGRRCNYNVAKIDRICDLLLLGAPSQHEIVTPDDKMVEILWTHYLNSGFLSARILDHLNHTNLWIVDIMAIRKLILSLPKKPFTILSIHDCFRCLPNYGNDLRKQYANILHLIAKSDLLNFLLTQITGVKSEREKGDPTLADDILNTEYVLS